MRVLTHFVRWAAGVAAAETQTTDAERSCLAKHAADRKRLVEVGVWHGVTTCVLRRAMASDGVLFAVDPFPRGRLGFSMQGVIAHREVGKLSNGRVVWLRLASLDSASRLRDGGGPPVDFVFIDGDHAYAAALADWNAWSALVRPGGVVALHDSRSTPERPLVDAGSEVVTREVVLRDARFEVVDTADSLTVVQRRDEPPR